MKHIIKNPEPIEFINWKNLANDDWKPNYNDLRKPEKPIVKLALMVEQGYICCYCERRIVDHDSHIEHFVPQENDNDEIALALVYSNMLCSCFNETVKGVPLHCGQLRGSWFDADVLVSPLEPFCEKEFNYLHDGTIQERSGSLRGKMTIEKLGLDIPRLNAMRNKAIEPFLDFLMEPEFEDFVEEYLNPINGKFNEFHTTIQFLFAS